MVKTINICEVCGKHVPQWRGRCPECGAWGSLLDRPATDVRPSPAPSADGAVSLAEFATHPKERLASGLEEFDRVAGGGVVPSSTVLLTGEPGVGKSTLVLHVAAGLAARGKRVLIASGEESGEQIAARASRLGLAESGILLSESSSVDEVIAEARGADVAVVDSVQTLTDPQLNGSAGSVAHLREAASQLIRFSKSNGPAVVLIGHVTKEGVAAGPKILEHLVDVVLTFEGEASQDLRVLRAHKNRFGATSEIGLFQMDTRGLAGVSDASKHLLADRIEGAAGSALACLLEGSRAFAVEVQALAAPTSAAMSKRVSSGFDSARLALLSAVVEKRTGIRLAGHDLYLSVPGGMRVTEPAADLAAVLAVASAGLDQALPARTVAIGEVGLVGEIRSVRGLSRRVHEARRLGLSPVLVPAQAGSDLPADAIGVRTVLEALDAVGLGRLATPARTFT